MKKNYDDILYCERPVSLLHKPMTMLNRAAQFSPFAALDGYEEAIEETERLTDIRHEKTDDQLMLLSEQFLILKDHIRQRPEVAVLCFREDKRKEGGSYETISGKVRRIDENNMIIFENGEKIPADDIYEMTGDIFKNKEI